LLSFQVLN